MSPIVAIVVRLGVVGHPGRALTLMDGAGAGCGPTTRVGPTCTGTRYSQRHRRYYADNHINPIVWIVKHGVGRALCRSAGATGAEGQDLIVCEIYTPIVPLCF